MKIAVVYWSGTGNTKAMAEAMAAEIGADLFSVLAVKASDLKDYDGILWGCPAMGMEELEEAEFQPVYTDALKYTKGKKVGLFGSYGWGTGEWLEIWTDDAKAKGLDVTGTLAVNNTPDEAGLAKCREFAKEFKEQVG